MTTSTRPPRRAVLQRADHREAADRADSAQLPLTVLNHNAIRATLDILLPPLTALTVLATAKAYDGMLPIMSQRLLSLDLLLVAHEGAFPCAYGGYQIFEGKPGVRVLYENMKITHPALWGRGHGRRLSAHAANLLSPSHFAFRTQNPAEILSVKRVFPRCDFAPIDRPYQAQEEVRDLLLDRLAIRLFAPATGLCYAEYGTRFGTFTIDYARPDICAIESKLADLGLCRERGDAVLIVGRLVPALHEANGLVEP